MKKEYFINLRNKLRRSYNIIWENTIKNGHKITLRYGNITLMKFNRYEIEDLAILWERRATKEWTLRGRK